MAGVVIYSRSRDHSTGDALYRGEKSYPEVAVAFWVNSRHVSWARSPGPACRVDLGSGCPM